MYISQKKSLLIIIFLIFINSGCTAANTEIIPTPSQTDTTTIEPTTTPSPIPNPLKSMEGSLIFNILGWDDSINKSKPIGTFVFNPQELTIDQIDQSSASISDVSRDGERILYTNDNELSLLDLSNNEKTIIADYLFNPDRIDAFNTIFLDDIEKIAFIGQKEQKGSPRIYISDYLGEEIYELSTQSKNPYKLLGYRDNSIYWIQGELKEIHPVYGEVYSQKGIFKTDLNEGDVNLEIGKFTYDFCLSNDGNFLIHSPAIGSATGSLPPTIYIKNYPEDKEMILMGDEASLDTDLEAISREWKDDFQEDMDFIWSPGSNYFLLDMTVRDESGMGSRISSISKVFSSAGDPVLSIPRYDISRSAFSLDEKYLILSFYAGDTLEIWNIEEGNNIYNLSIENIVNEILDLDVSPVWFGDFYFVPLDSTNGKSSKSLDETIPEPTHSVTNSIPSYLIKPGNSIIMGLGFQPASYQSPQFGINIKNPYGAILYDIISQTGRRILENNFAVIDTSIASDQLLVCDSNRLYIKDIDSSNLIEVADNLYNFEFDLGSYVHAYWLKDINQIAYVGENQGEYSVYLYDPLVKNTKELTDGWSEPISIYPSFDNEGLYFKMRADVKWQYLSYDGEISEIEYSQVFASSSGNKFAAIYPSPDDKQEVLNLYSKNGEDKIISQVIGTDTLKADLKNIFNNKEDEISINIYQLNWSPDEHKIFLKALIFKNGMPVFMLSDVISTTLGLYQQSLWVSTSPWISYESTVWSENSQVLALYSNKKQTIEFFSDNLNNIFLEVDLTPILDEFSIETGATVTGMYWID